MPDQTTTFLGIPVEGDIVGAEKQTVQQPLEDLAPLMQAVLDNPFVHDFGWRQYTPYFNDGDPCVFNAAGFWIRTTADMQPAPKNIPAAVTELYRAGTITESEYAAIVAPIPGSDEDDGSDFDNNDFEMWGKHPTLGGMDGWRDSAVYVGEHEELWRAAKDLSDAIDNGHFDNVLLEAFGDHAKVTVAREGIAVEFYEHG
jgi:hypothetical protein